MSWNIGFCDGDCPKRRNRLATTGREGCYVGEVGKGKHEAQKIPCPACAKLTPFWEADNCETSQILRRFITVYTKARDWTLP
jgi:hypothetical protein